MKIQIKSLEVKNCGPLRDVEIDFTTNGLPRPVTIIGGANGSGKTTILELIVALAHFWLRHDVLSEEIDEDLIPPEMGILRQTEAARINLLIDGDDFSIIWQRSTGKRHWNNKNQISTKNKIKKFLNALKKQTQKEPVETIVGVSLSQLPLDLASILYFPHYRRIQPTASSSITKEDISYKWVYRYEIVNSFAGSLDSYFVWLDYAYSTQFIAVKQFLNETVLVNKAIDNVDRSKLVTMVKLANGQTHRLDELSSGEQNLLIIMLELWRRLLPGSIVLIDEIENSLHPAFQHRLAEALLKLQAKVPFQLIVTTHAPSFLDTFGPESTLLLTEF